MYLICLAKSIEEIYAHLLKQSTPRQGTEMSLDISINIGSLGNNQRPVRGRKY